MKPYPLSLLIPLAVLAVAASGCCIPGVSRVFPKPYPDMLNVVAVDRSGSTAAMRQELKGLLAKAYNETSDRGQSFAVWAVDRESVCLYGPRKADEDRLPPQVYQQLGVDAAPSTATRTRPALFWEAMAAKAGESPRPVRIAYLTDGGNDFAGDLSRIKAAARKLGENAHVYVTIAGVQPDQRAWLEDAFAPLGRRFRIGSRGEESLALDDWNRQGADEQGK